MSGQLELLRPYATWLRATGVGRDIRDTILAALFGGVAALGILDAVLTRTAVWAAFGLAACAMWAGVASLRYFAWRLRVESGGMQYRPLMRRRQSIALGEGAYLGLKPRGRGNGDLFRAGVVVGGSDGGVVQLRDGGDVATWLASNTILRGLPRKQVERPHFTANRALRLTVVTFVVLGAFLGALVAWGAVANR